MKTYKQLQERIDMVKAKMVDNSDEFNEASHVPFAKPYKKAGERKDEYGNTVKNVAKHLAKKAMNNQKNEEVDMGQAEQGMRKSTPHTGGYKVVDSSGKVISTHKGQRDAMQAALKNDDHRVKPVREEIEQTDEALTGNQHKIDANKNGKVDAHDFHLLRKKKKVAEEAEGLDELSKKTVSSYLDKSEPRRKDYENPKVIKRMQSATTARSKLGLPTGSNRGGYGTATTYRTPRVAATEETNHTED